MSEGVGVFFYWEMFFVFVTTLFLSLPHCLSLQWLKDKITTGHEETSYPAPLCMNGEVG